MLRSIRALPLLMLLFLGGEAIARPADRVAEDNQESAAMVEPPESRPATPWGRFRGGLGILAIFAIAVACSENRRVISFRTVLMGMLFQVLLGVSLLLIPAGRDAMVAASGLVVLILNCAIVGAEFVFGPQLVSPDGPAGFVFAFRVLPTVIFVAALFAVLYQIGVMQRVVRAFAWIMAKLLGSSGAESLNVAASLFLGQTEAPLTIRPFLARLTRSELMVVMVSGMALVSGGILAAYIEAGAAPEALLTAILMNAPASIVLAKILVPETGMPETIGKVDADATPRDANVIDAAARGTREGLQLALNIAAILITFLALIALVDVGLNSFGGLLTDWSGGRIAASGLSLASFFGFLFAPVAWMIGVPWADCPEVGNLLGSRLMLNELVAYGLLGDLSSQLQPRSVTLATIALCGFANISSIGIQVGGIGALVPERRSDLARLGLRALFAATLTNLLTASVAGLFLP